MLEWIIDIIGYYPTSTESGRCGLWPDIKWEYSGTHNKQYTEPRRQQSARALIGLCRNF